jgi:hypothetical protein
MMSSPCSRSRLGGRHEGLVHAGQHYADATAGVVFRVLDMPAPDCHLGVGSGPMAKLHVAVARVEVENVDPHCRYYNHAP